MGRSADHRAQGGDLGHHGGDQFLAAKSGIDGHHANQVDVIQQIGHGVEAGGGVDRQSGLAAQRPDRLQGAVDMGAAFEMGGQDICAGLGERLKIGIDRGDHQVDIHDAPDMGPQGCAHRGAKGDVGHEMAVHHIDMDPVRPLRLDRAAFGAEIGEIGGEDGGGDLDAAREGVGHRGLLWLGAGLPRGAGRVKGAETSCQGPWPR